MAQTNSLSTILTRGLARLSLNISPAQQQLLLDYVALLSKWNQAYNLTAVRDPVAMITRHLLDSLAIAPYLHGNRIADVGTGAGLPGIPLAITFPDKHFVLLDSNGKKIRFLFQVKQALQLTNVEVIQTRVETYQPSHSFSSIVSRAFAAINDMLAVTQHLGAKNGQFLAMKGIYPEAEIANLAPGFSVIQVHPLPVPELNAERHLICLGKKVT